MTKFQEPSFPAVFTQSFNTLREFDKNLISVLGELTLNLKAILDAGISRSDNLDQVDVTFTSSATPDAENTVAHTLGKIPTGFRVITKNKAGDVYGTPSLGTAWSATNIYLKVSVASVTAKIEVF